MGLLLLVLLAKCFSLEKAQLIFQSYFTVNAYVLLTASLWLSTGAYCLCILKFFPWDHDLSFLISCAWIGLFLVWFGQRSVNASVQRCTNYAFRSPQLSTEVSHVLPRSIRRFLILLPVLFITDQLLSALRVSLPCTVLFELKGSAAEQ